MNFNELSLYLFNNSSTVFNLLVFEEDDSGKIFESIKKQNIVGRISDINFKILTVEDIIEINSEKYYKINYKNKIKGYFKPNGSVLILPKSRQQVKLIDKTKFNNELNSHLKLNESLFNLVKMKILYSSSFVIFNDLLYEMILYKNDIVGFFPCHELEHLVKQSEIFRFTKNSSIYQDSSLKKKIDIIEKSEKAYSSDYILPTRNILKFKFENIKGWVSIDSTDLDYTINNYRTQSISEALIQSIIYQYDDKLSKAHSYHLKIMNKELNKIKGDQNKN